MNSRVWKLLLIVGVLLIIATAIVLPFLIVQTATIEPVDYIDTPFEWFTERYCKLMLSGGLWMWLLIVGVVLTVVALVMRKRKK